MTSQPQGWGSRAEYISFSTKIPNYKGRELGAIQIIRDTFGVRVRDSVTK
jgi:hypothetical protein